MFIKINYFGELYLSIFWFGSVCQSLYVTMRLIKIKEFYADCE